MLRKSLILIVFAVTAPIFLGIDACSEPREFCKVYPKNSDRKACSEFCSSQREYAKNETLRRACNAGQLIFLHSLEKDGAEAMRECDSHNLYAPREIQSACRAGVAGENARYANYKKSDPGTAGGDRETGNRSGSSRKQHF